MAERDAHRAAAQTSALKAAHAALRALPLVAFGAYAANWLSGILFAAFGMESPPQPQVAILMDADADITLKAEICISAIVIAPLYEEAVFRFCAYRSIMRRMLGWGPQTAAVMSAILFAAVHLHIYALPALFWVGYTLARLYGSTGTLLAPIFCHSLFNALNAILCLALAV